ncbi:hypothetical protein F5050DRAFT_1713897 [Lentinula boryana]|uniref:ABM domain-containing protein n=1 Tax=Lentinula boryana TaxID=40481 RepID=A0ABQ8Q6P3_9AGAR|nr:hypothetical protein F5050DRAFT_1713897 [Lentinula boryana]
MSTGTKIIQYISFPASDAFIDNRYQFTDALEKLKPVDGHLGSFWGLQVAEEGGKTGYLVTIWESIEHHKKFTTSDAFSATLASFKPAAAGELTRFQFTGVRGSPIPGLQTAATEFVIVRPNAGTSGDAVTAAANKAGDSFEQKGYPVALGQSVHGDGVYIVVIGWPSVAESRATVKQEPFATAIGGLSSIATLEISHAVLDRHT